MTQWAKVKDICIIIYGKRYPNMPHQRKECMVLAISAGRPCNALVGFRDGSKAVVPIGNLRNLSIMLR